MGLEHEKAFRNLTNYIQAHGPEVAQLRDALGLIAQSDKEFVKIKATRDSLLAEVGDAQREKGTALQELAKAKEDNAIAIVGMQNNYADQETKAKKAITPTLQKLHKAEGALWDKTEELNKLIATKTVLAAELDVKADTAEKRAAAAIARIKKAKEEIALVEEE